MAFDASKFETVHQVGGIRTGRYDWPDAGQSKKYDMNVIVDPDELPSTGYCRTTVTWCQCTSNAPRLKMTNHWSEAR